MGWILVGAPLLILFFGVLWLVAGFTHVARGNGGKAGRGVIGGGALTAAGLALSILGINTQGMARLTHEGPVAEISVRAVDPAENLYDVTVQRLDADVPAQTCRIQGDEWLISGRVQKWKPWANALGLNATYTLNEISNKYGSAERGNGKPITSCDIAGPIPQVNQYLPDWMVQWLISHAYVEDRRFGDANYMPLADGAHYRVVISQFGFITEPENDTARGANDTEH